MQPVSANFLAALRGPHTIDVLVSAWRGQTKVDRTFRVLNGQVSASASLTDAPRRSLSVELAPEPGVWTDLAVPGTYLKAWRGIRFVDGTIERVPLGVFDIDEQSAEAGPAGGISLTCPDVWTRVARARFEKPRAHTTGSAHDQAVNLAVEAVNMGTGTLAGDSLALVRGGVWERDREEAVAELARAAGSWIHTDPYGQVTSRRVPKLSQTPVWTVDASESGVLLSGARTRSRQRTYNVVVVIPAETDGSTPFAPVVVADNDTNSPTYVGGAFGRVPFFYSSQLITTTGQAQAAGEALLRRVTGRAAQLDVTAIVNPALEPGDVITVLLPAREGTTAKVERHLVDAVTVPLTPEGTQSITTRSSRPEGDVPEGV